MTLVRSVYSNNLLHSRWLYCYMNNRYSVVPATALSEPSTNDQETETNSSQPKYFNISFVNSALLLGTVTGIKMFPMQSNPDRNWALIFLKTQLPKYISSENEDLTETSHTNESDLKFKKAWFSASNRVHVFNPKLVSALRDLKLGERLLVSGFLSYYQSSKLDGKISRQCCVTAQRIAHMGWSNDYQSDKNLEMTEI
ncbi:unnamed protein product [Schistosoma turkestanicum]|nr:unnamed protein product [Schistosoma turkestanicum]